MTTPNQQHATREGIDVQPGQVWEDLDGRQEGRRVTVVRVDSGKAQVRGATGKTTWLSISRMHKHSTGFRLVEGKS